jgi:hypothetical protein
VTGLIFAPSSEFVRVVPVESLNGRVEAFLHYQLYKIFLSVIVIILLTSDDSASHAGPLLAPLLGPSTELIIRSMDPTARSPCRKPSQSEVSGYHSQNLIRCISSQESETQRKIVSVIPILSSKAC